MLRYLLPLLVVVAIAPSCARKYWYQEGRTLQECETDLLHAKLEATKHGYVEPSPFGNPIASGAAAGFSQALRETEIIKAYMRAKGYRLLTEDEIKQLSKKKVDVDE